MLKVVLTLEGSKKIREEITHIKTIKIPQLKKRLKRSQMMEGTKYLIACTKDEIRFYEKRIPYLKGLLLSAAIQRHSNQLLPRHTEPHQIVMDKIDHLQVMIKQKREDIQMFSHYRTCVKQVALLVADQSDKLESDIQNHEKELSCYIEDAKIMGVEVNLG
ncbi:hypothetical protein VQL36_19445 [Chengkuizengella sp. SCS-71B]|uniref:hypothetical protein n=1 Tax=Chengkuizengella sp. SCS-71B TaxID=3115290 RepID=UPI0032C2257E